MAESAHTDVRAPVFDPIVRAWLTTNTDLELDIWSWRPEHYCTRLAEWGKARNLDAGSVEEATFEYATRDPKTWPAPATTSRKVVEELSRLVGMTSRSEAEKAAAEEALDALSDFFGES